MLWKSGRIALIVIPLLLFKEGHVSSGIEYIRFENMVSWSDAILLVRKKEPYVRHEKIKYSDSLKEEFQTTLYSYDIVKVIRDSDGIIKGRKSIDVHSATDSDYYQDTKLELEGGPRRMRVNRHYKSASGSVESEKEFLIFIRFGEQMGWFHFTAGGAMESKKAADSLWSLLPKPTRR